jgi:hypothetical protein
MTTVGAAVASLLSTVVSEPREVPQVPPNEPALVLPELPTIAPASDVQPPTALQHGSHYSHYSHQSHQSHYSSRW